MFGIYGYNVLEAAFDPDAEKWHRACRRGAAPVDDGHKTAKRSLDQARLHRRLYRRTGQRPARQARARTPAGARAMHRVSWRSPDPQAYLSAIEARLLRRQPTMPTRSWRSD